MTSINHNNTGDPHMSSTSEMTSDQIPSLYERLGGAAAVDAAVDIFITKY